MQILKLINHDNLIKFNEIYESNEIIFLITNYLSGGDLSTYTKYGNILSEMDISRLMISLLNGLNHLHSKGIMHRDIKPENIMLKTRNQVQTACIIDYGLSEFINQDKNFDYGQCGTPGYIAPEIINYVYGSNNYDEKCDIFSLGCVFYEL